MKKDIHPHYNSEINAQCACGHSFKVGSTRDKIEVEVCSNCHPFFTGEERIIDTAGRVEKFKARRDAASKKKTITKIQKKSKKTKTTKKE